MIQTGGIIYEKEPDRNGFILDKSGSMSGLEADTIGGFNGMIERQKKRRRSAGFHGAVL
jgi:hypothetical protein